jgi:hypothetical protein
MPAFQTARAATSKMRPQRHNPPISATGSRLTGHPITGKNSLKRNIL